MTAQGQGRNKACERALLPGEDNAEYRRVRARVEHAVARMNHYKILRVYRRRGNGLRHAVQAVAHMHNPPWRRDQTTPQQS